MRLILVGSEYAGKTTLARAISNWMIQTFDLEYVRWHNHWVVPYLDRHMFVCANDTGNKREGKQLSEEWGSEELDQIMAMKPSVLEQFTRHMVWRHLHPDMFREPDLLFIDGYYADAVYAPIYYGFGESGSFADRQLRAREWERELFALAPDTILVLISTTASTIRTRMSMDPHLRGLLTKDHVDEVIDRFHEEYTGSLIAKKISIDTTVGNVEDSLDEFVVKVTPLLCDSDLIRVSSEKRALR